jgi:hypothetical protein
MGCSQRHYIYYGEVNRKFTPLKARRLRSLVLPVKVGWRQGAALVSDEGKVMGCGLLEFVVRERI